MKIETCLTYVKMFDSRNTNVTGARHEFALSLFKVNHIMTKMVCLQYLLKEYTRVKFPKICRVPNRVAIRNVLWRAPLQGCPFFFRMLVLLGGTAREISKTVLEQSLFMLHGGYPCFDSRAWYWNYGLLWAYVPPKRSHNVALYKNTAHLMLFQ
jgi:hypothetical protein